MSVDLTASIVRILKPDGTTVGTGFVVSEEGLIATCSHVVQSEESQEGGDPRPEYVDLVFYGIDDHRRARVVPDWWRPAKAEDVAILNLEGPLPKRAEPLPLGSSQASRGHEFTSRGYRLAEHLPEGLEAEGKIQGSTSYQGQPVLQLLTNQIDRGMSGAPIWDVKGRRVVGMVNTFWETSRHVDAWLAFATPTEILRTVCPALQVSDVCPYRSLDAFTEADAEFFFGRQRVVERLLESLRREPRFLAVLGPSGSGKSSLLQAGLIPQLRQGAVPGSDRWGVIVARPADQPFHQLEAQGLTGTSEGLVEAVQAWLACHTEQTRLVLVIDQFEELLVTCPVEVRQDFVTQLTRLLEASLPITVILAMRDDFYSRFAQEAPTLLGWLERGLANVPLTLEEDELRAIVEEPARAVGLSFETGLVDAILEDAMESAPEGEGQVGRSTILPLLEFALAQLWERRRDGMLTHKGYGAIGRVTGGLTQWADRAFYGLEEQQLACRVLTDLVHLGNESQGLPDNRRRQPLDALCRHKDEREAVHQVVQRLADARLLATGRDLQSGQETVELIHDSLLREWGLLRRWLREDRRFLAWRQTMGGQLQTWEAKNQDEGTLLRGVLLTEAEEWLEKRGTEIREKERVFIEASQEARRTEEERRIRDLEIINDVAQIISTKLDPQDLLLTIVYQIADRLNCTHCTIFLLSQEDGELLLVPRMTYGERSKQIMLRRFRPGEGLAGWVFQTGESLVLDNAMDDPRFSPAREKREQPRSMLVAPVKVGDKTIGVISADQYEYGWFSERDRRLVDALAVQAGVAIERANGLALLQDIGNEIISAQEVSWILPQIVAGAIKLTNTTSGAIYLIGEDRRSVVNSFLHPPDFVHPLPRIHRGEGITQQVIATGDTLIFPDIRLDERINPVLYDRVRSMIAVPLKLEQRVVGVLYLNDADPHAFTETEISLLSTLASQAAIAIENARLFQALDDKARQLARLQAVTATISAEPFELDKVLILIVDSLGDFFPGASCTVRLYDSNLDWFGPKVATGLLADLIDHPPRPGGTSRYVVRTGVPRYLEGDALTRPSDGGPIPSVAILEKGVKATAYLPLLSDRDVIGILYVYLTNPYRFSQSDKQILELFAGQAAIAIENARLYQNLARRIQQLEVLTAMSRGAVSDPGIDRILDLVYGLTARIMDLSDAQVQIALYDETKDEVSFPLVVEQDSGQIIDEVRWGKREAPYREEGEDEEVEQFRPLVRRAPPGLNEYVIRLKQPLLIVEDFEQRAADLWVKVWPTFGRLNRPTGSWLGVPMLVQDRTIGVISAQSVRRYAFEQEDLELLATVASQAAVAIENVRLYASLQSRVEEPEQTHEELGL